MNNKLFFDFISIVEKVLPIYLFLIKPSLYLTPSL